MAIYHVYASCSSSTGTLHLHKDRRDLHFHIPGEIITTFHSLSIFPLITIKLMVNIFYFVADHEIDV